MALTRQECEDSSAELRSGVSHRNKPSRGQRPKLKDLYNQVVPWWAPQWRQLGEQLKVGDHLMNIIEHDYPNDCETCCSKILTEWLDNTPAASWKDLTTAINNLSLFGNKDLQKANDLLCQRYLQNRYIPPTDDWPPYHPKHYTPLTIIHHDGSCSETEVVKVAQGMAVKEGSVVYGRKVNSISDLFAPFKGAVVFSHIILIEGAPGIGKTILSKEIALQWANHTILHSTKLLFLLFMRDPWVKNITNIPSLVNYFCEGNSLANKVSDWLVETDGKYLTIVIDGYDEFSEGNNLFISQIINREKLTKCGMVVTSRPAASSHLQNVVDCRAEVLGFTEENRHSFIQNALHDQLDIIDKLKTFLQSNPFLNTLCYIPLNMSILLSLTEDGVDTLPKTQTRLYEKFIIMTITHFLKKGKKISTANIASFNDLPHPYDQVVKELSHFAFIALKKNQLVFSVAEIKAACPTLTPSNWFGFGLLKCAQYFKPQDGCDHESFHFLHFAIQEYMAAHHIASLPYKVQLNLLHDTFWSIRYYNTWMMYVGITGGDQFAFRHYLSGNYFKFSSQLFKTSLSSKMLTDKIKCLHLLQCLAEVDHEMLPSVENVFQGGIIDLSHQSLSLSDVHTLAVLLLRSPNKQWEMINLSHCSIDDKCCDVLCEIFHSQIITVKAVDISNNNIYWESLSTLANVLKSWNTEQVIISPDALYKSAMVQAIYKFTNRLQNVIGKNSFLGKLLVNYITEQRKMIVVCEYDGYITCAQFSNCHLDDEMVEALKGFTDQTNMKVAYIDVSVYVSEKNANVLPANTCVTICGSNLHSKGVYLMNIASVIINQNNSINTVIDYLAAVVHHSNQSHKCYLNTLPPGYAAATRNELQKFTTLKAFITTDNFINYEAAADDIIAVLSHNTKLQELHLDRNNFQTADAIKIARSLQSTSTLSVFAIRDSNLSDEVADDIAYVLSHNTKLQKLHLGENNLQTAGAIKIMRSLKHTASLTVFNMEYNTIGDEAANDIASVLSHNTQIQKLYLGGNNLQTAGAIKIMRSLKHAASLTAFDMRSHHISDEAADDIAAVLSHNTKLQELYLGGNNLHTEGAIKITRSLQNTSTLTVFALENSNISGEAADDIAAVLCHTNKLQELHLSGNNLPAEGAIKIARSLKHTTSLTVFDMRSNQISDEAADDIASVLSYNTKLKELHLGGNNLQTTGTIKIAKALQNATTLTTFDMHNNNIGDKAADDIAAVLSHNSKLQKLYLGGNNLQTAGAIKIMRSLKHTASLTAFDMRSYHISDEAADFIAAVLYHNTKLQELYLGGNDLQTEGAIKIARSLQNTSTLKVYAMGNSNISDEAADYIAAVLSHNTKLQELYLGGNNIQTTGAIKIMRSLKHTASLTAFDMRGHHISDEAANDIAAVLSHNIKLQKLYLGGNNLPTPGTIKIMRSLKHTAGLMVFDMEYNNIGDEVADNIAAVLFHNTKLQELYLGGNNLQTAGTIKIMRSLKHTAGLMVFDMQYNNIGDEAADDIAAVLFHNTQLQELHLDGNSLKTAGAIKIIKGLQNIFTLTVFAMENNNISDEAADDTAAVLSHNTKLKELYLGGNTFKTTGAVKIMKSLQNTSTLTVFDMCNNNISDEVADIIAAFTSHIT